MRKVETADEAERRLLRVIAAARLDVFEQSYGFEPLRANRPLDARAVACVRDGDHWFQLVPMRPESSALTYTVFSLHFAEAMSASGFVGWLASHLKRTVGTGVIVVCGRDARQSDALDAVSLGLFDYWGCPSHVGEAVIAEVRALVKRGVALTGRG
jgi:hypothetical protein